MWLPFPSPAYACGEAQGAKPAASRPQTNVEPLSLLVKVKDARKLQGAVEQLVKAVAKLTSAEVSVRKRTYLGVETREVHVRQQGFFFVPTYAVHKDWLVVALYPQPVMGYLQRAAGIV